MPKEEWGTKRICPATGKRFYDLNKTPIVSPYTGEIVNLDTAKAHRAILTEKPSARAKNEVDIEDDDIVLDDDDDSDVDLGDDVLEDDDDDEDVSLDDIADMGSGDDE